jgi:hypothetical protein
LVLTVEGEAVLAIGREVPRGVIHGVLGERSRIGRRILVASHCGSLACKLPIVIRIAWNDLKRERARSFGGGHEGVVGRVLHKIIGGSSVIYIGKVLLGRVCVLTGAVALGLGGIRIALRKREGRRGGRVGGRRQLVWT